MQLQQNVSLKPYNTFGIDVLARYYAAFTSVNELEELFAAPHQPLPFFVLGGGSNVLFTKDFGGVVLQNKITGIQLTGQDENFYYIQAAAGENWHQLVMYCVANNYAGMENLSLIPGSVGASPIQNIGAYGVELKDVFYELQAYDIRQKNIVTFSKGDCRFGYRDSIFKREGKGKFIILHVTFRLPKHPVYNIEYGAIQQELEKMKIDRLSVAAVSEAVIRIRRSKLPDPAVIGNAGSFFKNPTVDNGKYEELKVKYPTMPGYVTDDNHTKLAAGWLIEQCGWKGYRKGDAGCYNKQALVLVNYGNATGADIYHLSEQVIQSVEKTFGIWLEREVNIVA